MAILAAEIGQCGSRRPNRTGPVLPTFTHVAVTAAVVIEHVLATQLLGVVEQITALEDHLPQLGVDALIGVEIFQCRRLMHIGPFLMSRQIDRDFRLRRQGSRCQYGGRYRYCQRIEIVHY